MDAKQVVEQLNIWLQEDPITVMEIFVYSRVEPSNQLIRDKNIQCNHVDAEFADEEYLVGPLTFINGLLDGSDKVCMVLDDHGVLEKFDILRED